MAGSPELLKIRDLDVSCTTPTRATHALRGVDLALTEGQVHAIVGESGSGKTITAMSIMGLIPVPPWHINGGKICFRGSDLLQLPDQDLRRLRGTQIAMIFQEPAKYLNPSLRVGGQITEMLRLHLAMGKREAEERVLELFDLVGLKRAGRSARSYPHELSGGMKQRAMIAMAISCGPRLLIADEPTTALDVTLQVQILRLLLELKAKLGMAILFISHDLGGVRDIAKRVSVMYAGRVVETASQDELFNDPMHPYTGLLLQSQPDPEKRGTRLTAIRGKVPDGAHFPPGCAFHPRCHLAESVCRHELPATIDYQGGRAAACHMIGTKQLN